MYAHERAWKYERGEGGGQHGILQGTSTGDNIPQVIVHVPTAPY